MSKTKTPTEKQVKAEIEKLREMKPFVVQYTAFGDNNHHRIDAQIRALEEMEDDEDVDDAYPEESQMDIASCARDAVNWKTGDDDSAPSDNWKSLDSRNRKAKKS